MTLISYNLNITNTYSNGALYDASTNKYTSGENQNEGINEWGIENDSSFNQLLKFNDLTKNYKIKFKAKVLSEGTVVDINFKLVKSSIVESKNMIFLRVLLLFCLQMHLKLFVWVF